MTERWRKRLAERPTPPFDAERIWVEVQATATEPIDPTDAAPSRGRRAVVALVAFTVFLPIAVTGWFVLRETPVDGPAADRDVLFPTWVSDERPLADVSGILIEHDGCLFLRSAGEDHLILWERGYSFADGAILDASGIPIARLGDVVSGGGGYGGSRAWAEEITGTTIPNACVPSGAEPFVRLYDVVVVPTVIVPDAGSPRAIAVGQLPQVGIAVSDEDGLALLDAEGNVIATVPGFEIVGNAGAPGLWLHSTESGYYLLDPAAGSLVPAREARDDMYDESLVRPDLPPPYVGAAGHWRYQLFPGFGTASLAQWSGECEVPTAFWIDANGTQTIITGEESIADAPTSVALGWTPDGDALVLLPEGHCGGTHDGGPGIYAFSRPGDGRVVYPTDGLAEMWEAP